MASEDEKPAESGEPRPSAPPRPAARPRRSRWLMLAALLVAALLSVWRCG